MWLVIVYVAQTVEYKIEKICIAWDERHPKTNPQCTANILCEHWGRHKQDCLGGLVPVDTYWRKMRKI